MVLFFQLRNIIGILMKNYLQKPMEILHFLLERGLKNVWYNFKIFLPFIFLHLYFYHFMLTMDNLHITMHFLKCFSYSYYNSISRIIQLDKNEEVWAVFSKAPFKARFESSFLDVSKAFYCKPHDLLIAKIKAYSFDK